MALWTVSLESGYLSLDHAATHMRRMVLPHIVGMMITFVKRGGIDMVRYLLTGT